VPYILTDIRSTRSVNSDSYYGQVVATSSVEREGGPVDQAWESRPLAIDSLWYSRSDNPCLSKTLLHTTLPPHYRQISSCFWRCCICCSSIPQAERSSCISDVKIQGRISEGYYTSQIGSSHCHLTSQVCHPVTIPYTWCGVTARSDLTGIKQTTTIKSLTSNWNHTITPCFHMGPILAIDENPTNLLTKGISAKQLQYPQL